MVSYEVYQQVLGLVMIAGVFWSYSLRPKTYPVDGVEKVHDTEKR